MKKNPKITTQISYHIFEITEEGHFIRPTRDNYGYKENVFDQWNGYESIEKASEAILERAKEHGLPRHSFVVLPIISLTEDITDQEM